MYLPDRLADIVGGGDPGHFHLWMVEQPPQNFRGTLRGADPRGLLLVTHLDTVDPGPPEFWTETGGNPFALTQKGHRLFGLGSADTKLDALCKLFAAHH